MRSLFTLSLVLAAVLFSASASLAAPRVQRVAAGLDWPVFVTAPPGDTTRVFIVEAHTGAIRILRLSDLTLLPTPFLTVPGVSQGTEQGLLGLAFHPNYANNGLFYVYYTNPDTQVVRYHVSIDPNVANPASATPVLSFFQPQPNHNGGWIGFGPDGELYIASGDGGAGDDNGEGHTPDIGNGQDITDNLLGKILRIDVDGDDFPLDPAKNYAIPLTNPFVGALGDDEIWAYGLRNPWRASFDRATGNFYIGDVGQGACEEIDVQFQSSPGGENYGWRLREGLIETPTVGIGGPKPPGAIDPILNYPHSGMSCSGPDLGPGFVGIAITGGYVYRGPVTQLVGRYFFADFGTAHLWSLVWDGTAPSLANGTNFIGLTDHSGDPVFAPDVGAISSISSFGEDAAGNLYILDLDGEIFRLPEPAGALPLAAGLAAVAALGWWRDHSSNTGRRFSRNARIPSCASGCCDAEAITSVA
jgi:glucose/arabinose dehydrogenase